MRYTHFLQRTLSTGEVTRKAFDASHYTAMGLLPSTIGGMPILEAHQLINRWNVSQRNTQRHVYGLESA